MGAELYRHNVAQTGVDDPRPIGALAIDPALDEVVGGLWGRTELGVLFLDMFFLPKLLRGRGIGGQLLTTVESEAIRRCCQTAVVETSTFQAPDFYERHGYREFARIPFNVGNHARAFLSKALG